VHRLTPLLRLPWNWVLRNPTASVRIRDDAKDLPESFVTDNIEQIYKRLESAGKAEFETGAAVAQPPSIS
jgi:hypothetical protein